MFAFTWSVTIHKFDVNGDTSVNNLKEALGVFTNQRLRNCWKQQFLMDKNIHLDLDCFF